MSTGFVAIDPAPAGVDARARRQFNELELEHALRATAAQQLRVAAAAHARPGVEAHRIVLLEQAIADRIDRIVRDRRAAAERAAVPDPPRVVADELAARRGRATRPAGRSRART